MLVRRNSLWHACMNGHFSQNALQSTLRPFLDVTHLLGPPEFANELDPCGLQRLKVTEQGCSDFLTYRLGIQKTLEATKSLGNIEGGEPYIENLLNRLGLELGGMFQSLQWHGSSSVLKS